VTAAGVGTRKPS